jgi:predicted Zn-dependent protease
VVGNTLFKMGKVPEAEAEYRKALALEPGNALLRDRLSIAHARAQNAQGAQDVQGARGTADRKSAKEP